MCSFVFQIKMRLREIKWLAWGHITNSLDRNSIQHKVYTHKTQFPWSRISYITSLSLCSVDTNSLQNLVSYNNYLIIIPRGARLWLGSARQLILAVSCNMCTYGFSTWPGFLHSMKVVGSRDTRNAHCWETRIALLHQSPSPGERRSKHIDTTCQRGHV